MKILLRSCLFPTLAIALAALAPLGIRGAEFGDRLGNLSTRAQVGTGANVMVSGFVVNDGAPKKILIRAIGPALTAFAVTGPLSDPVLSLYDATLASWFGVSATNLSVVLPNIGRFARPNLGFLG